MSGLFRRIFPAAFLAICLCLSAGYSYGWQPRKALLYGIGSVDTPALYPQARLLAWLQAVQMAQSLLPGELNWRLRQLGLPLNLARQAVAALRYPLDVTTPEHAADKQVRVFLKTDADISLEQILAEPWRLLLEMCFLQEIQSALAGRESLENPVEQAGDAAFLRRLWQGVQANALGGEDNLANSQKLQADNGSVALLLMRIMSHPEGEENLRYADRVIELCMQREVSGDASLWAMLGAMANYLRARGQERQGRLALAETDLATAIGRMQKSGIMPSVEAETLLARAELRRKRGNTDGMCADFRAACALGMCQSLARARRQGMCGQ